MALSINLNASSACMGPSGLMTSAGNPWSVPDSLALELVNRGVATAVNWPGAPFVAVAAEAYSVDYNASPAFNVARMNMALSQNKVVTLTKPGQYLFGGPGQGGLVMKSTSTIICSRGVELILADQTFAPLISNEYAFSAPVYTGLTVQWVTGAPAFSASIVQAGIEKVFPVGSWVGVLGLVGTNGNNRGYQGVWQVKEVALNTIKIHLLHQPPNGGNSAATAAIYRANSGMRIIGGLWDGNKSGQQSGSLQAGEMRSHIQGFRNAQNIIIKETEYRRGFAWSIGSNNVRDVTVSDIECNLFDPSILTADGSAVFQMSGGARNVLVERVTASCGDNIIAASLDVIGSPGTATYLNHDPGDTYDITIRDISSRECNAAPVALWGNANYLHHNVLIERVSGKSPQAAVQISSGYAPTNLLNTNGGSLTIRDIAASCGSAPVLISSDGTWDSIDIDGVRNEAIAQSPLVQIAKVTTTQTIKKVRIKNVSQLTPGAAFNRALPAIQITDSNIEDLSIEGLPSVNLTAGVSAVVFTGTLGNIKKATITGLSATSTASGNSFVVSCENTNPNALDLLTVRDCGFVGLDATGGIVRQATTGRVTRIRVDNYTQVLGKVASGVVRDNLTGGQTAVLDTVSVATT